MGSSSEGRGLKALIAVAAVALPAAAFVLLLADPGLAHATGETGSAGFLGLDALATPKVLLDKSGLGFVIAVPVGLVLASATAARPRSARLWVGCAP